MRPRSWLAGLGIAVVVGLGGPFTAAPALAAVPAATCADAEELLTAGLPQRSMAMLQAAGAEAVAQCSDAWQRSSAAVAQAETLAAEARTSLAEGDPTAARSAVDQALAVDRENAAAAEVATTLQPSDDKTGPQQAADQNDSFAKKYVQPTATVLAPILAVLIAIVLVVRVLPLLFGDWPKLSAAESRRAGPPRGIVLATGVVAALVGSYLLGQGLAVAVSEGSVPGVGVAAGLVVYVAAAALWAQARARSESSGPTMPAKPGRPGEPTSSTKDPADGRWLRGVATWLMWAVLGAGAVWVVVAEDGDRWAWLALAAGGLAVCAAAVLLGWWLATGLRLAIVAKAADGKDDGAAAAHVAALLGDLGAAPPRGLETPAGTDATELTSALAAIPGAGSLASRLGSFLAVALGGTPWRGQIACVEGGALSVQLSRNGRSVGAVVIRPRHGRNPSAEGTASPVVDLQRLAAAFILTTLDRYHGPFPGLAGATDWRSVGLHYIATTDLASHEYADDRVQVLARAVEHDPQNLLAQLAWKNAQFRRTDDDEKLRIYEDWLEAFIRETGTATDLLAARMRAAYTQLAVTVNRSFVTRKPPEGAGPGSLSKRRERLDKLLSEARTRPQLSTLVRQLEEARDATPRSMPIESPDTWTDDSGRRRRRLPPTFTTPTAVYNLACAWASWDAPAGLRDKADRRAIALLHQVADLPEFKAWLPDDPQLAELKGRELYHEAFRAKPRDDFFGLPTVTAHAKELTSSGFDSPAAIAGAAPGALQMVPGYLRAPIHDLALLDKELSARPDLRHLKTEILHELHVLGIGSRAAMNDAPSSDSAALQASLCAAITKRCKPSALAPPPESPPPQSPPPAPTPQPPPTPAPPPGTPQPQPDPPETLLKRAIAAWWSGAAATTAGPEGPPPATGQVA